MVERVNGHRLDDKQRRRVGKAAAVAGKGPPKGGDGQRPQIVLNPGNVEVNVPLAERLLNRAGCDRSVFQRGEAAVVVAYTTSEEELRGGRYGAKLPEGAAVLRRAEEEHVAYSLERLARVVRLDKEGSPVPADVPARLGRMVLKNSRFRPLLRVVRAPTPRRDGSLLDVPGYDQASALIYAPNAEYPEVKARPTRGDARKALERLARPFRAFPFVAEVDRAVILAELLTLLTRHLYGKAPGFMHRASEAGSGKTLLADGVSIIATGAAAANVAAGVLEDGDELRKLLTTWTLNGTPVGVFDNMPRGYVLDAPEINRFLTAETYGDRLLGGNTELQAPVVTTVVTTGNRTDTKGDASRRNLISDLDAGCERPELRDFDFDFLAECRRDRAELAVAALTILRAYAVAGFPAVPECADTFGSFEEWSRWVRFPLVWAGSADPVRALDKTRTTDEERVTLGELLERLARWFPGSRFTAKQAAHWGTEDDGLADALLSVAKNRTGEVSPERLGRYLKANAGRVTNGFRLLFVPDDHAKTAGYLVEPVEAAGGCGGLRVVSNPTREPNNSDFPIGGKTPRIHPQPPADPRPGGEPASPSGGPPPWSDAEAWLARLRPLKGDPEAHRVEVLAWGKAAGCGTVPHPARGGLTLVVPPGVSDCPAKFALLKQARDVGLRVEELEGARP